MLFVLLGLWIATNGINATAIIAGAAAIPVILLVRLDSTHNMVLRIAKKAFGNRPSSLLSVLGGLPIALAFAIPYSATRSWILGATFMVVSFSTSIQSGMIGWIFV